MKKINLLFLFCSFFFCRSIIAQASSKAEHAKTAEAIKELYNKKQFAEIYRLTSPYFQQQVSENDVVNLLGKDIYAEYGSMIGQTSLAEEKDHHSFLLHFKTGRLKMDLLLDDKNRITLLQFLPYREEVQTKIINYLSDNKKQNRLDSVVEAAVLSFIQSPQNCGISIGISTNGTTSFYNYGETSRGAKTITTDTTIYEIGSVTKTFCGLLLANAVTEKRINLEDDIRDYLPGKYSDLTFGKSIIRIKHLVNHTSGLPSLPENIMTSPGFDSLNPYKNYSKAMMLDQLKKIRLQSEPGKDCEYSNYGMAILGLVLEDIYKKTFEELVKEKITLPNNMKNTTITLSGEQQKIFAQGYNGDGIETPHWDLDGFRAAGAFRSNTRDLMNYLDYNLKEEDAAAKLAHTITFSDHQVVGLSWFISKTKAGNSLIWHNGGTYGFSSFCGFIKEKNCSVVILANSATNVDYIAIAILNFLQR